MNKLDLSCRDEQRRHEVRRRGLNGLDYLEVDDSQLVLTVYFLDKLGEARRRIQRENVRILGGRRIRDIWVMDVGLCIAEDPERDDCMQVFLDRYGDFSTYTLCLVEVDDLGHPIVEREVRGQPSYQPLAGFDRRYACLKFSFKAGCPSDLDCKPQPVCPPPVRVEPEVNYLAKDYASFRQLILDRLALIMPDWQERHVPDLGIALVELLAYTGDYLSYYQDAVATEAYLDTARQRISVRRHARLVDYPMHEGNNARTWVHVEVSNDTDLNANEFYFITGHSDILASGDPLMADDLRDVPLGDYEVFEPLLQKLGSPCFKVQDPNKPIHFRQAHNAIQFYTWGDRECCLPRGATRATLVDGSAHYESGKPPAGAEQTAQYASSQKPEKKALVYDRALDLHCGDFLLFEEVIGPKTGNLADADPSHRHVVRLTSVQADEDALCDPPQPLLEVEWVEEDALPFPLRLTAIVPGLKCEYKEISVARGNVLLVDHGRTVCEELEEKVPPARTTTICEGEKQPVERVVKPGLFRPTLQKTPLTFSQPLPPDPPDACSTQPGPHPPPVPAARLLQQDPHQALPQIELRSEPAPSGDPTWLLQRDLLASREDDQHFVVEMDDDRRAHLRFGDGELGRRPEDGMGFTAAYRVGNGPAGNVGAKMISKLVLRQKRLSGVTLRPRNPFPAQGGMSPEPLAEVKLYAPHAFRKELQRAITADDYARLVERDFTAKVQRAAAQLRWTGSWYEVLVAVDQRGTMEADPVLLDEIKEFLGRYRRIGHDVQVVGAQYVPLDIKLVVCVLPDYLCGHVEAALRAVLGNRRLPDGQLGFFHPDNLTFGEGIYLSKLVALARAVPGVENVVVERLQRQGQPSSQAIDDGALALGPFEVARLDNDPSLPENGQLELDMQGGR
jgi:hypothetical protein